MTSKQGAAAKPPTPFGFYMPVMLVYRCLCVLNDVDDSVTLQHISDNILFDSSFYNEDFKATCKILCALPPSGVG